MPFLTQQPFVDAEGNEYPFLTLNIICRPEVRAKNIEAPTAINLQPYRVLPDGTHVLAPEIGPDGKRTMRSILMADAFAEAQRDPAVAQALGMMMFALQEFITAKGV
jgi:hypothetical protein